MSEASDLTLSLTRVGDHAGKSFAKVLKEDYKVKKILEEWAKSNPNMDSYGENGIAHFVTNLLSPIFREIFAGFDTTVNVELSSVLTLLRVIKFDFTME